VPLAAQLATCSHVQISVDGNPGRIMAPGSDFFAVAQSQRGAVFRLDIELTNALPETGGDGIPDWWMLKYFGHATGQPSDLSRAQDDADGDGLSNGQEYLTGTDPTNFNSVLALQVSPVTGASNAVSLTWPAVPGKTYQVQYKNDLNASNWTNYSGRISLISRQGVIAVPASQATRFFRAVCVP